MIEFFKEIIAPFNLPYTALLGLVLLYWCIVMMGALSADSLDFDVDADADVDMDMDADADVDADTHGGGFAMGKVLAFFNVGKAPFMIILSLLILKMWIFAIFINHYIGPIDDLGTLPLFFGNFIGSLFLTKYTSYPFARVYQKLEKSEEIDIVGKVCTLKSKLENERIGQGEIFDSNKHLTITVQSSEGELIPYGSKVVVIDHKPESNIYIVAPYNEP